jgi:beta-glucosidase
MLSVFLPPFEKAIRAGCATIMTAYQAIDGVPCTANRWLLHDVLREEWGFDGFVVTDWNNVGRMHDEQRVYANMEDAVKAAAESGNDMIMSTPEFYDLAIKLVRQGRLDVSHIDRACRRILELKFRLGLFDQNRYPPLEEAHGVMGCRSHREKALEAAYQSIILLKNEDNVLPLTDQVKRIAVIGPNADDMRAQLGDWVSWSGQLGAGALARARDSVVTVLDGIRARAGEKSTVEYVRGCDIVDPDEHEIDQAVAVARRSDVAVIVVGDTLEQTGETRDRADLSLSGSQQALVEAIYATGIPTIVVLINGKPLTIPWIAQHIPAIVEAWNPGLEGGTAVAGILFGDRSPSGKLTISFPHHVGQQPVYYNQVPGWHGKQKYVDMPTDALFAFGYGESYGRFDYSDLQVENPSLVTGEALRVNVLLTNRGSRGGTEIVQLYVNDVYSSVTTPIKDLKAFKRAYLEPGESERIHLAVPYDSLALVDRDLERVVEPGAFEVMVGSSSRDQDLLKSTFQVGAQE